MECSVACCGAVGWIASVALAVANRLTYRDIMTTSPIAVPPEMAIAPAITLMLTRNISCLPVVHEGATCGVLTTTDVLLSCQCLVQVIERIASGACLPQGTRVSQAAWTNWEQEEEPLETAADTQ